VKKEREMVDNQLAGIKAEETTVAPPEVTTKGTEDMDQLLNEMFPEPPPLAARSPQQAQRTSKTTPPATPGKMTNSIR